MQHQCMTADTSAHTAPRACPEHRYPSLLGVPALRQAVARHSERHQGLAVDWTAETLVTVGATEGIAAAFMGLVNPGDEVRRAQAALRCAAQQGRVMRCRRCRRL